MKKIQNKLIQGTLLLTIAGFVTRLIGFAYRIFLADILGTNLLGVYQLVFPVYGICFTIFGAGMQTAISQLIASNIGTDNAKAKKDLIILRYGLIISLLLSCSLTIFVFLFAGPIAAKMLLEPACAPYLKILCLLFPFCGITACINGYFYGKENAKTPAITQIMEQLFRVFSVVTLCTLFASTAEGSCRFAVFGIVIGEFTSCLYNCFQLFRSLRCLSCLKKNTAACFSPKNTARHNKKTALSLLFLAFTLTTTKLVISVLHSVEAIFIPAALKKYGCSAQDALSIYGILSGIALPFILFPSAVTNSLAVMLLPAIAQAQAEQHKNTIRKYVTLSAKYSLLIGYLFTCIFLVFGKEFGIRLFQSTDAGIYICVLSWLCPFSYLSTTFTSIINGLGKTQLTFFITAVSLLVKIYFLIVLVPQYGIQAYLAGALVSEIAMTVLEGFYLHNYLAFSPCKFFLIPAACLAFLGYFSRQCYQLLPLPESKLFICLILTGFCLIICLIYIAVLFFSGCIQKAEWSRKDP